MPVLETESPRFAFPLATVEVFVELLVRKPIHAKFGNSNPNKRTRLVVYKRDRTNTRQHAVIAAAELGQHRPGVRFVSRFPENLAANFRYRVCGYDHRPRVAVCRLWFGEKLLPDRG